MKNQENKKQEEKKTKKKVPRCHCRLDGKRCKKKLSAVDLCIICKCGKTFCPKHRTPESHNCKITEIIALKNKEVELDKSLGGGKFKQIEVI